MRHPTQERLGLRWPTQELAVPDHEGLTLGLHEVHQIRPRAGRRLDAQELVQERVDDLPVVPRAEPVEPRRQIQSRAPIIALDPLEAAEATDLAFRWLACVGRSRQAGISSRRMMRSTSQPRLRCEHSRLM